jgi:hypothetical protein
MHLICPWCGQNYTTGIVGSMPVGTGHDCRETAVCSAAACEREGRFYVVTPVQRLSGESPEDSALRELATAEFRCGQHLGGVIVLYAEAVSTRA